MNTNAVGYSTSPQINLQLKDSPIMEDMAYISGSYVTPIISATGEVVAAPRNLLRSVTINGKLVSTPGRTDVMEKLFFQARRSIDKRAFSAELIAGNLTVVIR